MNQKGFTLLELMIAFALLTMVLASVYITQIGSLGSSARSRNALIATNLARNFLNETELKYEGMPFDRLPKKDTGNFEDPHKEFTWTRTVDEVDFSALSEILLKEASKDGSLPEGEAPMVLKFFQDYLQKSVRRLTVTIEWPEGKGNSSQTFSELLVNYDAEMPGM